MITYDSQSLLGTVPSQSPVLKIWWLRWLEHLSCHWCQGAIQTGHGFGQTWAKMLMVSMDIAYPEAATGVWGMADSLGLDDSN